MNKMNFNTVIEMLLFLKPELSNSLKIFFETQKVNFNNNLENRIDKEEQKEFIKSELNRVRTGIESDLINNIYSMFCLPIANVKSLGETTIKSLPELLNLTELNQTDLGNIDFSKIFEMLENNDTDSMKNGFQPFINQVLSLGIESPEFEKIVNAKNPLERMFGSIMAVHYQKQYLQFLKAEYNGINVSEVSTNNLEKIEWLGTQKQLAELFVELENKGWIKEKKVKLISAYFDRANTIFETLKPVDFDEKGNPKYSNVYTKTYSPVFKEIKHNTIKNN